MVPHRKKTFPLKIQNDSLFAVLAEGYVFDEFDTAKRRAFSEIKIIYSRGFIHDNSLSHEDDLNK
jgi:hypothetical protein